MWRDWAGKKLGYVALSTLAVAALFLGILPKRVERLTLSKPVDAEFDESMLDGLLKEFRLDCDRYPTAAEGLNALRRMPPGLKYKWKGPYADEDIPNDPWGNPYRYDYPGADGPDSFTLTSFGADGRPGGVGDDADIVLQE